MTLGTLCATGETTVVTGGEKDEGYSQPNADT